MAKQSIRSWLCGRAGKREIAVYVVVLLLAGAAIVYLKGCGNG